MPGLPSSSQRARPARQSWRADPRAACAPWGTRGSRRRDRARRARFVGCRDVADAAARRRDRPPAVPPPAGRRVDRSALRIRPEPGTSGLDGGRVAAAVGPLHGPERHGHRDASTRVRAVGRPAAVEPRPDGPGPRALCRRECGPGGAVRLTGHDRGDLPRREPPRLRRVRRRRLVSEQRRVQLRRGRGAVVGVAASPGGGGAPPPPGPRPPGGGGRGGDGVGRGGPRGRRGGWSRSFTWWRSHRDSRDTRPSG